MHLAVVGTKKDGTKMFWNSMSDVESGEPGIELYNCPDNLSFSLGGDVLLDNEPVGFFVTYDDVIRWVNKINDARTK
jgi:hypothetical protein